LNSFFPLRFFVEPNLPYMNTRSPCDQPPPLFWQETKRHPPLFQSLVLALCNPGIFRLPLPCLLPLGPPKNEAFFLVFCTSCLFFGLTIFPSFFFASNPRVRIISPYTPPPRFIRHEIHSCSIFPLCISPFPHAYPGRFVP